MLPILTRYGSFFLYSYTVVMGLGLLLAVGAAAWDQRARRQCRESQGLEQRRIAGKGAWLDGLLWGLALGLIVGRTLFVAVNWDYFRENVQESWLLWRGGISYHGAIVAGLTGMWAWTRLRKVRFARLGDLLAIPAALWSTAGWLACYMEGCAYGREVFMGPLAADLPDSYGVFAVRYQTQLIGVALSLLALLMLSGLRRRSLPEGALWWTALLLLSAGRAAVGTLRGDEMPLAGGMRVDVLLDAALAGMALVMLVLGTRRNSAAVAGPVREAPNNDLKSEGHR